MPRVTVIGTGYLGLTHAVCLADLGHEVLAIDVDEDKIAKAANGEVPFFEPGLEPLLRKNLDAGRLRFTTSFAEVGAFGEVHFLCVGTPQGSGGGADLSFVHAAAGALAPHLTAACLIVGKSTVPVGTARQVLSRVRAIAPAGRQVDLAWNPEFLREGHAVQDSLTPDRIVLGVTSDRAEALLREVYATPLEGGVPLLVMDLETAELVKVAANAFLATKISFINAMAEMCEASGADVMPLAEALGYDARIGRRFLSPGLGFGGGCLPKDVRAFRATASALGVGSVVSLLSTRGRHQPGTAGPGRHAGPPGRGRQLWTARGWPCSAWRSSPTATTCGIRPAWPCATGSGPRGRSCPSTTRWRCPTPRNDGPTWCTHGRSSRRPRAPTWCCTSPSGPTTRPSTRPRWAAWWRGGSSSTPGAAWTPGCGTTRAGPCACWAALTAAWRPPGPGGGSRGASPRES